MGTIISQTKYKDVDAVAIESGALKAAFLPDHGGKMASLVCKKTGREFLVQADGLAYKKLAYAGDYVAAECSGFDDMFPTIDEYTYEKFPWQGVVMPDHGEVCGLKWEYEILEYGTCLHMWVYSVRFSYRLDKWIRFVGETELTVEYEAKNLSQFDLDFIWAGHVMINAEQGAKIVTPYPNSAKTTCVFSSDEGFCKPGMTITWPRMQTCDGETMDIGTTQAAQKDGNTYKFYFDEAMSEGCCGYRYQDGTALVLNISIETVPYLGIWINDGAFKDYRNIALEPCTGTFDDPKRAIAHGQNSILPGNGEYAWVLSLRIKS